MFLGVQSTGPKVSLLAKSDSSPNETVGTMASLPSAPSLFSGSVSSSPSASSGGSSSSGGGSIC